MGRKPKDELELKVDKEMMNRLRDKPIHLDLISSVRGTKSKLAMRIASAIKDAPATKTLPFTVDEFFKMYPGKFGKSYLKIQLKKFGVRIPRIVEDDGIVHIYAGVEVG